MQGLSDAAKGEKVRVREIRFAWRQTLPICVTYIFIGLAFGMLMTGAGYGPLWSVCSAVFIYAGSLQIILVPLLQAGAPLWTVAVTTFFVNARHMFYGVAFVDRFRQMGWRYPYMVLSLTDETYCVLCGAAYEDGMDENRAMFAIALLNHFYWIAGCALGACAGALLPWDMTGIDFASTAFFLVVVLEQWQKAPSKIPALVGFAAAIVFLLLLGADNFLIAALSVSMLTLLLCRERLQRRGGVQ